MIAEQACGLSYTSFDDGTGRGGWRIKDTFGDLTAATAEKLTAQIVTRFDLQPQLSRFPTPEEVAGRPARLAYLPQEPGAVYWHTVDAGHDASGRPGNVFAQVVVDRRSASIGDDRPIERWGSDDWLRPYGPAEVLATALPRRLPAPNPEMTAAAAVEFLADREVDRQLVFGVIMDAVSSALAGGPAVVVLTRDHEESARWILAVSHFLPVQSARALSWSTHDLAERAAADVARGMRLITMPVSEQPVSIPGAVVIDVDEEPSLGGAGQPHRIARGVVPAGALSSLVEPVLADEATALRVLGWRDRLEAEFGDQADLAPAWPLAMAVGYEAGLADYHDDMQQLIAEFAPDEAFDHPKYQSAVAAATTRFPPRTADLAARLEVQAARGRRTSVGSARLLAAALADRQWLASADLEHVPAVRNVDLEPAGSQITGLIDQLRSGGEAAGPEILRLAVLLDRLAAPGTLRDQVEHQIRALLSPELVAGYIWHRQWPENLSPNLFDVRMRAFYFRALVAEQVPADERLETFPAQNWRWLMGAAPTGPLPEPNNRVDATLYPFAVRWVLTDRDADVSPEQRRDMVVTAVGFAAESSIDDERCRQLTADLIDLAAPGAATLQHWVTAFPGRVSPNVMWDLALQRPQTNPGLLEALVNDPDSDPVLRSGAALRLWMNRHRRLSAGDFAEATRVCLSAGPEQINWYADDLAAALSVGHVALCAQSGHRAEKATVMALAQRITRQPGRMPQTLRRAVDQELISQKWVAGQSALRTVGRELPSWTVIDGPDYHTEDRAAWADEVIGHLVATGTYRGPVDEDGVLEAAWSVVRQRPQRRAAETMFARLPKLAKDWLKNVGLSDGRAGVLPKFGLERRGS